MTNTFSSDPYGSGATTGRDASSGTGGGASDLKDEARNVASDAGDAGKHVVGVAKEETRGVASETKTQARRLVSQVGTELRDQAAHQQSRAASGIRDVGSQFQRMADSSDSSGVATNLVSEAGRRVGQVGDWLDQRDPKDLLDEVKRFARRRPGVFLAIAAGAGVVVGRLTRALASSGDDSSGARSVSSTSGTTSYAGATGAPARTAPPVTAPPVTAPPVTPPRTTEPPATTTIGNPAVPGGTPGTTGTIGGAGLNPGTGGL